MQFDGRIVEFPTVRIDRFTHLDSNVVCGFISHVHSDHLGGLTSVSEFPIYATETTKRLIVATEKYSEDLLARIQTRPLNVPMHLPDGTKCTLIPNYHCLGSVMVLLESKHHSVLFTGDTRFDAPVLSALAMNHQLSSYHGNKWLDNVYLDTTFSYRLQNISMLDRYKAIERLLCSIKQYPDGTTFRLVETTCGFEEVWLRLAMEFGRDCIVLSDVLKRRMTQLKKVSARLELMVNPVDDFGLLLEGGHCTAKQSQNTHGFRFLLGMGPGSGDVDISAAVDLTSKEYHGIYTPKLKGEFKHLKENDAGSYTGVFEFRGIDIEKEYIRNERTKLYLPSDLRFVFSRHSSCSECLQFLSQFEGSLREVYPIVADVNSWMAGFTMKRYFAPLCTGTAHFRYDIETEELYGATPVMDDEPIQLVNYWPEEEELHFKGQAGNEKRPRMFSANANALDVKMKSLAKYKRFLITHDRENKLRQLDRWRKRGRRNSEGQKNSDTGSHSSGGRGGSGGSAGSGGRQYEDAVLAKSLSQPREASVIITCSIGTSSTETESAEQDNLSQWMDHILTTKDQPISVKRRRLSDGRTTRKRILRILK